MDDQKTDVGSAPATGLPVEGWMLREDVVREVLARRRPANARSTRVNAVANGTRRSLNTLEFT
jgi:hypothetical protein